MSPNNLSPKESTSATSGSKNLVFASLICLCLAGVGYSQWVSSDSRKAAEQMRQSQRAAEQSRIKDIARLFEEHQQFILLLGRHNSLTRDSVAFVYRCRSELESFIEAVSADQAPSFTAEAHHRLAQLDSIWGDRSSAIVHLQEAIRLAKQTENLRLQGYAFNSLGVVQWELGSTQEAVESFELCSNCLTQLPSEQEIHSVAVRNLALAKYALGSTDLMNLRRAGTIIASSSACGGGQLTPATEIYVDSQMIYAQQVVRLGRMSEARRVLRAAQDELAQLQAACQTTNLESEIVSPRSYDESADALLRNLSMLNGLDDGPESAALHIELDWHWLFDLQTEVVSFNPLPQARMYAEFENQSGLALPWTDYTWAQELSKKIISHTHTKMPLHLLANNEQDYYEAIRWMESRDIPYDKIRFSFEPLDSPWLRDMGPIAARTGQNQPVWIDSHVVRDGMKQWVENDELPRILNRNWETIRLRCPLSIEGGAIATNGNGITVCSTKLLEVNEQFGFSKEQIETTIRQFTGASDVIYLEPLADELNRHLDMFLTFTDTSTVVVADYPDQSLENARLLDGHADTLSKLTVNGRPLRVVRVPMPPDPKRQFLTYTNVIFANGVLLVPSWATATPQLEQEVVEIYQNLLPDWEIILVDCSALADRGGALHCFTSNLGLAPLKRN